MSNSGSTLIVQPETVLNKVVSLSIHLEAITGPHQGKVWDIDKEEITIGREPSNDIVLNCDTNVSRSHAKLLRTDTGWAVIDGNSTNGTYVKVDSDLTKIHEEVEVARDNRIQVGQTQFSLEWN